MYKYILWDFDGTLIDSYPEIKRIYKEILEENNILNPDMNTISDYLIRYSSTETKMYIEKTYGIKAEEFEKIYREKSKELESIYKMNFLNDSKNTVFELNKLGIKNFIVTNRSQTAIECLKHLDAINMFEEIVYNGLNGMIKRKPDPEGINYILNKYNLNKKEVIYIGDRDLDIKTSNNAGIDVAIYRPIENYKLIPNYILANFKDLIEIVKNS